MVVPMVYAGINFRRTDWLATGLGLLMIVSFALALAGFTLFLSARVRRPFIALAMVLGTLLVTLVVFPAVMFSTGTAYYGPLLTAVNPYLSLAALGDRGNFASSPDSIPLPIELLAVPQIAANLFIAVAFLVWTERTLAFADNEVRFLPGKKTRS
jgi:ABC-type transport system involved in multi-copper enzyme maturation permease subunit